MYNYIEELTLIKNELLSLLFNTAEKTKKKFGNVFITQPSANGYYFGLWPDDWFFPNVICPRLLSDDEADKLFVFLTENIENLPVFPDRIEPNGHCVFQPGPESCPHGKLMPLHLPAAWLRLINYLFLRTGNTTLKNRWFEVSKRSVDNLVFKFGLPFVSEIVPQVAFGFFDTVGLAGNDLMCSVILEKALRTANDLFGGDFGNDCLLKSEMIRNNIHSLKSLEGYFISDSKGCSQFSPWSNGLLYCVDYISENDKSSIRNYVYENRDKLIKFGMVKHVLGKWIKMNPVWTGDTGTYMDGGFWSVGTAFSLKMLYDKDKEYTIQVLRDMLVMLKKDSFPEWIDADNVRRGAPDFLMSLALPLAAITAILDNKNLIDFF